MKTYTALLAFAWSETKYGVCHSFGLFDQENGEEKISPFCQDLENELRDSPGDEINSNYLSVSLPESLVKRIQEDAIQAYFNNQANKEDNPK